MRIQRSALVAYVDQRVVRGAELDEQRLGEALEAMLAEHRRRGSPADALIARGATIFVKPATRGRVEARLGWLDNWPAHNVHGHGMTLGFVALADVSAQHGTWVS